METGLNFATLLGFAGSLSWPARYANDLPADEDLTPFDIRWESMQPMLEGEQPLMVQADQLVAIQSTVAFTVEHKLRLILFGHHHLPRPDPGSPSGARQSNRFLNRW